MFWTLTSDGRVNGWKQQEAQDGIAGVCKRLTRSERERGRQTDTVRERHHPTPLPPLLPHSHPHPSSPTTTTTAVVALDAFLFPSGLVAPTLPENDSDVAPCLMSTLPWPAPQSLLVPCPASTLSLAAQTHIPCTPLNRQRGRVRLSFLPAPFAADMSIFSLYVPSVGHQGQASDPPAAPSYTRSRSATGRFGFLKRTLTPDPSPSRPAMSTVASQSHPNLSPQDNPDLNTLPDPRTPSPSSRSPTPAAPGQHPDLSNEVAALSTKLINAINHQTNLDDALQETRHELEAARERIAQLEAEVNAHKNAVDKGLLVRRVETDRVEQKLQSTIAEERQRRNSAEREKKGMEQELETLTSQLFEEANGMVASARQGKEAAERARDQMKGKLEETEILLASQQDQLAQLKTVLQDQALPREASQATSPSTPTAATDRTSFKPFDFHTHTRNNPSTQSLQPPESPLHFTHLIHPVVRTDVQAYDDFVNLLRTNKGGSPPSRVTSGNFVGLNVLGLGSKELNSQSTVVGSQPQAPVNSSRSTSAGNTPTISGSYSPNPSVDKEYKDYSTPASLKDTKYYKRALVEDIEPCLRLDQAPGLSWLARRTVLNSMTNGKLIVEPFPPRHAYHSPAFACALCGETRTSEEHIRRHRFRTSDSDDVQRYPVCDYCLTRVRATCDFTVFLRMARKGNMRNDTGEDCRAAWEECIKLRERMFWSRVGGGVVPVNGSVPESPMYPIVPGSHKSSIDRASRSDSDLPSISQADSSSITEPLDKYGDLSPKRETSKAPSNVALPTMEVRDDDDMSPTATRPMSSLASVADRERMPPPPMPDQQPTQPGASQPAQRDSSSTNVSAADSAVANAQARDVSPVRRALHSRQHSSKNSFQSSPSRPQSSSNRLSREVSPGKAPVLASPTAPDRAPREPSPTRSLAAPSEARPSSSHSQSPAPRRSNLIASLASKFDDASPSALSPDGKASSIRSQSISSSTRGGSPERRPPESPTRQSGSRSPTRRQGAGSVQIPGAFN